MQVLLSKSEMLSIRVPTMKKHKKSLLRFSIVSLLFSVAFIGLNMGVISTASAITCPTGYVDTKGVCFPTTTGLSDKKVDVILLNVMNWLLGVL